MRIESSLRRHRRPPLSMKALSATVSAALCMGLGPASALQVIDARDGVAVEAIVSIKEPTRIRIDGTAITDVFGNIYSSNCGSAAVPASIPGTMGASPSTPSINPGGEIVLECDRDKGEIYLRPVGDSLKPINLFVSSAAATYTLLLRRSDTPADTIVIRDTAARSMRADATNLGPLGSSANHVRAMKALLLAMVSDRMPPDMRVDEVNLLVPLWTEAQFALTRRYEGRGYLGEKYLLQNRSPRVMVLAEQEFDREDGNVTGVAIENHNLQPGETTQVFVIRRGNAR